MQDKTLDKLAVIYRETNDEKAFVEIQKRLRPLIRKRSAGARQILSSDDIEQTAALAIATAVLRYDPSRGSFAAFAVAFIIGELQEQAGSYAVVRKPEGDTDRMLMRGNHARRFVECEMSQGRTHAQAVASAATWFDVPSCKIVEALNGVQRAGNPTDELAADTAEMGTDLEEQRRAIGGVMSSLTDRERIVIEMRLREDGPPSIREIGDLIGVHFSNVPKIARRAMDKMKVALAEQGIHASDIIA